MGKNLELKARLTDFEETKRRVEKLSIIRFEAEDRQRDTFFNVPQGRLKLRESSFYGNILIPYFRPDNSRAKQSEYMLIDIKDAETLKRIFGEMFAVKIVVEKMRLIYLYENVRIYLDQVKYLGDFLEFEAVLSARNNILDGQKKIDYLRKYLNIKDENLISAAYADLLLEKLKNSEY